MSSSPGLPLHHYFYVSQLACSEDTAAVGRILDASRRRNAAAGITGMLAFDGESFAQLLEGPSDAVLALAKRIAADPRHEGVLTLHDAPAADHLPQRWTSSWRAGYAEPDQLSPLKILRGEVAVATFLSMAIHFDLA
jgi:hypothetical protein